MADDKKSFIETLVQNTPLAVIVLGVFLLVLAAAGGLQNYGIKIQALGWKIAIASVGGITLVAGFFLLRGMKATGAIDERKYGIEFLQPHEDHVVSGRLQIEGVYKKKPDDDLRVIVFEVSPTSRKWRPKRDVVFKENGVWQAVDVSIGGKPNEQRYLVVAVVGKNGQALLALYERASRDPTIGIEFLTSDIKECDRRTVRHAPTI